ncbi:hypothetical protein [Shewanella sp. KX20019]|uniref:hypothetical protein n=1 Tax=Shewanella sp. KX20019 TaxID=2803864 RepID=UPI001F20CBC0|nr:hypothetical protein [Shewanella sp. KX20019]
MLDNIEHYFEQTKQHCFRNLDRSIGAHIAEVQYYLKSLFADHQPRYFDSEEAWELSMYINQQPRKVNGQRSKKHQFFPVERFIEDCLYRFASGVSASTYPNVEPGNFPCPYQEKPQLRILK